MKSVGTFAQQGRARARTTPLGGFPGVRCVLRGEAGPALCLHPRHSSQPPPRPAAYSLEAVPGSGGAPQVLTQGVQELDQLLRAHGHLLPDQLQMLRGHRTSEPPCGLPGIPPPPGPRPAQEPASPGQDNFFRIKPTHSPAAHTHFSFLHVETGEK